MNTSTKNRPGVYFSIRNVGNEPVFVAPSLPGGNVQAAGVLTVSENGVLQYSGEKPTVSEEGVLVYKPTPTMVENVMTII